MKKIDEAIKYINNNPQLGEFIGGYNETQISLIENALCKLTPDFKYYLQQLGKGYYNYFEFIGLPKSGNINEDNGLNIVWINKKLHKENGMDKKLITFGSSDFYYVIDCRNPKINGGVYIWDKPNSDYCIEDLEQISISFEDFFFERITEDLE